MPTRTAPTLALMAALLSACGVPGPQAVDPAPLRAFAARGYASVEHGAVSSSTEHWTLAGQPLRLVLTQPVQAAHAPLVLYLPGLGEAPEAGAAWRGAWAAAGYAVLSVQALNDDATAWQSDLAREGSFRALGQRHYAGEAMLRRVQALADVLAEAQRRAAMGEAVWQHIDFARVAVAGFDLGAYTAMTLAGERVQGVDLGGRRLPIRAAIALSPFADVARGGMDTRYGDIRAPVLSITSDADGDPLGLVAGAAQRRAPFEHMPGPDQYLLSLQGVAHAGLGGGGGGNETPAQRAARRSASEAGGDERASRGRGSDGASGGGGRRRGGGGAPGGGAARDQATVPNAGNAGTMPSAASAPRGLIAAQDVSTAFLDAYLRDDAMARDWLRNDAPRWMGAVGELRRK